MFRWNVFLSECMQSLWCYRPTQEKTRHREPHTVEGFCDSLTGCSSRKASDGNMIGGLIQMTVEEGVFEAAWVPLWYELDQNLAVGAVDELWFFTEAPQELAALNKVVLFRGLTTSGPHVALKCRVLRIHHPILGDLEAVETRGLDYCFVQASGERIEVNAEEEPGAAYDQQVTVRDWSLTVWLQRCSSASEHT